MTSDIDALASLAEAGLNPPQNDQPLSVTEEVRKLALRALTDATEHRSNADRATALYEGCMDKHHELLALADRIDAAVATRACVDTLFASHSLGDAFADLLERAREDSRSGAIRPVT